MRAPEFADAAFEMVRSVPFGHGPGARVARFKHREAFEAFLSKGVSEGVLDRPAADVLQRMMVGLQVQMEALCSEMEAAAGLLAGDGRLEDWSGIGPHAEKMEALRIRCECRVEDMKMILDRVAMG